MTRKIQLRLSTFAGMKPALILNRVQGGRIGALCRRAVEQRDQESPRYILQGRDENTGLFLPREETIPQGESQPRLLAER